MTSLPPLRPCPSRPCCVCTLARDARHHIEPIAFTGPPEEAQRRLSEAVRSLLGTRIVSEEPGRIVAESRTPVFRFVDDLDLRIDAGERLIHFRSASRLGFWDLGVNRRRMERLRRRFARR
jgi:uncharacterized protein (DUF1499 family)